jgi:phosphoribosyl 1,2-cyclic phosphodiesterase
VKITCWGARGSIAVSGKEYLTYGGDTTCLQVVARSGEILVLDSGSGVRRLGDQLLAQGRLDVNMVFTHAHWDHISGFPFFKPLYTKGARLSLHGCPFAQESIRGILAKAMKPPFFPVQLDDAEAAVAFNDSCIAEFDIGSIHLKPVLLSHPNQGLGYKLTEDGKSFVFLTDNELGHQHPGGLTLKDYVEFCGDAELLLHDAQYTEREYPRTKTWGHSLYRDALELARRAGVRRLGLFHHDQDRTDAQIEAIVADCREVVRAGSGRPDCFAVAQDAVFEV